MQLTCHSKHITSCSTLHKYDRGPKLSHVHVQKKNTHQPSIETLLLNPEPENQYQRDILMTG